jgi:integrase
LRRTNAVQLGVDHAEGLTKGRKARSVPVPQTVLELLAKQCEGRGLDDLVFGDGTNYLPRPKSDGGWFVGAVKRAGSGHHTARSPPHLRLVGHLRWGERDGAGADARPHRSLGDAAGVRRLVRHRP